MRALNWIALTIALVGCSPSRSGFIVESPTPIVANGTTAEALGIETLGGIFTRLIEPGVAVPCSVSETFSTASDGQTEVIVSLFRGTESLAKQNQHLGRFKVVGIPPAPRGGPKINVTFAITEGAISLAARDLDRHANLAVERVP
jgi:molecular chaperone DnaK